MADVNPLAPTGVRLTFGDGVVDPTPGPMFGVKGFAVGLEYPVFAEPYGDLVSWHHRLDEAEDEYWARIDMFMPPCGTETQVHDRVRVVRRYEAGVC